MAVDEIVLQSPNGRVEYDEIDRVGYALKPGGTEFYALALKDNKISAFEEFTGGCFASYKLDI